jgi:hypothetical protein
MGFSTEINFLHLIIVGCNYLTLIKESGFSETTTTAPSFPTPPPPAAIQFLSVQLQLIAPMRPNFLSLQNSTFFIASLRFWLQPNFWSRGHYHGIGEFSAP